ncbi:MAG: hypothetical protein U0Z53_12385 [Blastocatellia bacterium]
MFGQPGYQLRLTLQPVRQSLAIQAVILHGFGQHHLVNCFSNCGCGGCGCHFAPLDSLQKINTLCAQWRCIDQAVEKIFASTKQRVPGGMLLSIIFNFPAR